MLHQLFSEITAISYFSPVCAQFIVIFLASNELALVERPSPQSAYIRYNPSPAEQAAVSSQGVVGMFKVQYDVQRSLDAGDLYVSILLFDDGCV